MDNEKFEKAKSLKKMIEFLKSIQDQAKYIHNNNCCVVFGCGVSDVCNGFPAVRGFYGEEELNIILAKETIKYVDAELAKLQKEFDEL